MALVTSLLAEEKPEDDSYDDSDALGLRMPFQALKYCSSDIKPHECGRATQDKEDLTGLQAPPHIRTIF